MKKYLIKRLLISIPVFIGITLITFFIIHLTPGTPTSMAVLSSSKVSPEIVEKLNKLYDLDKPVHVQYILWFKKICTFNFGISIMDDQSVILKILSRFPATLLLNILSIIVIFSIALPLGIISAAKKDSYFDKTVTVAGFIGYSIPTFWFAFLLMMLFGVNLGWFPISGFVSLNFDELSLPQKIADIVRHLILPVFASSFTAWASISRYTRSSMLELISQDFIRTARAKGVKETTVIFRHAFRNALLPIITLLGLMIPGLIAGGVIFETIFNWPGMGRLGWEAVMARDYPVIMGVGVFTAILTLIGNLLADILYAYADPRIRYK